jgi:hypothetical protein
LLSLALFDCSADEAPKPISIRRLDGTTFFREGHGDGAQNYMICFEWRQACIILLANSDKGEFTFRSPLEKILGDAVTPWEWEGLYSGVP